MNKCPITYEDCTPHKYSKKGLHSLSRQLQDLDLFQYTVQQQKQLAKQMAGKLSIQGVQPKLSAKLNVSQQTFEATEKGGTYILKPPHDDYNELPQNEDFTMKCAALTGLEVPLHGMIYNIDHTLTYFIKRFDRKAKNQKVAVEDFSQLLGLGRDTKYDSSLEQVIHGIEKHCTFPATEKLKLFRLVIFNFLIGNEDMHLKNLMLIRQNGKVDLSPAYDLVNTTLVTNSKEEMALPLHGKKSNFKRSDFVDYLGIKRMQLSLQSIETEFALFEKAIPEMLDLLKHSFLSEKMQEQYEDLILKRWKRLNSLT